MKKTLWVLAGILVGATMALAQSAESWVHVRVVSADEKGETVKVNVPMSLAVAVLPAIHSDDLHDGKVHVRGHHSEDIDLRAVLEAVSKSPDNEYVTVESKEENVRVAKSGEYILIKVTDHKGNKEKAEQVDVKVPMSVVKALLTDVNDKDELNVLAALEALKAHGPLDLVTVHDGNESVRIWVDSKSTAD